MALLRGVALTSWLLFLVALAAASCGEATPTPTAGPSTGAPTANPLAGVPGILEPSNRGWPREVEGLNGRVVIRAKPERIITISLGHDEITYALVPAQRVVAVGAATKDSDYSNVVALAQSAVTITAEAEKIVAQRPGVIVTSPFARPELVDALTKAGIPVVQTDLHNDSEGRIQDILLMGYIYGEEERAVAVANEVKARYEALQAIVRPKPTSSRPRVLSLASFGDQIYTAGKGSTEGSIIEAAGGINAAAEAGLSDNPTTSVEGIVAMKPDVVIITQTEETTYGESASQFKQRLLTTPVLAGVPAIQNGRIYAVQVKLFTTLSFWNIRGAEELAKLLWPQELGNREFPPFSFAK